MLRRLRAVRLPSTVIWPKASSVMFCPGSTVIDAPSPSSDGASVGQDVGPDRISDRSVACAAALGQRVALAEFSMNSGGVHADIAEAGSLPVGAA